MTIPIQRAYVQSGRTEIARLITTVIRQAGLNDDVIFREMPIRKLIADLEDPSNDCLVVLDWEMGVKDLVKILRVLKSSGKSQSRPSLLIAAELSNTIISLGAEYGIWQVHTGDVSSSSIRVLIQNLLAEASEVTPVRTLLTQVEASRSEGDWPRATQILEALANQDDNNPRIIVELAENYFHTDQCLRAQKILEPLTKDRPDDIRALNLLGRCYAKLGRFGEASKLLEQAKILNPYNLDRLLELGEAFLQIDKVSHAHDVFDEAEALDPKNKEVSKGKAQCMLMDGEVNEGLKLIRNSASKKELASIFNTSAVLTMRRNQHGQAMKLYDAAIQALGDDPALLSRLYYNKGVGNWKFKMAHEAQDCFKKAVDLDPANRNAAHNLRVFEKSQKLQPAAEPARSSKSIDPILKQDFFEIKKIETDDFISIASPNMDFRTESIFDDLDDEDEKIA